MKVKNIPVPKEQIKALKEGAVTFYAKCISPAYSPEEQDRISGKYVLVVLAAGALLVTMIRICQLNATPFVLGFLGLVVFSYQIMNSKLTQFDVIGKASFDDSALVIVTPDYFELKRMAYQEIGEIKSKSGNPDSVFAGKGQERQYQSLHVTFYLKDETTYTIELSTELARIRKNEQVVISNEEICLEDLLRMVYEEYRVVDEAYYRQRKRSFC
ncbi:hypothetical protein [Fluviicola sp.]|uniref:hypothetical protein n=1 Tax=Fluviicola sp. TaxID=1917219 RepID=UPI0031D8E60F